MDKNIIQQFNEVYFDSHVWARGHTKWLGFPCLKCPLDLWVYQEIIYDIEPDIIIECGTYKGGTTLFLASICDLIGKGRIITVDIKEQITPKHSRITYLIGSSTSKEVEDKIKSLINESDKVMAILDSDHGKDHVLSEMEIYGNLVTRGAYLIVEDTIQMGGSQAHLAVIQFLKENSDFEIDRNKEKFLLTFNPEGYLKRIR